MPSTTAGKDLVDCILEKNWSQAKQVINDRPESIHGSISPFLELDENDEEHEQRIVRPLHLIIRRCCRASIDSGSHRRDDEVDVVESNEVDIRNDEEKSKKSLRVLHEKEKMRELARLIIQTSHYQKLKSKIECGSLPSVLSVAEGSGETPLHVVCSHDIDVQMVKIILENTRNRIAPRHVQSNTSQTCKDSAAVRRLPRRRRNHSGIVLDCEGNADADIHIDMDASAALIPSVIDLVTARNTRGSTPLHYLCGSQHTSPSTLRYVLEACRKELEENSERNDSLAGDDNKKRKPNITNNRPGRKEREKIVACGLEQIMMARDEDGETPLHWACCAQADPKIVGALMEYGAASTLFCPNIVGECPIDILARECEENVELFNRTEHAMWEMWKSYLLALRDSSSLHAAPDNPATAAAAACAGPCNSAVAVPFGSPPLSLLSATDLSDVLGYYSFYPTAAVASAPNTPSTASQDKSQQLPQEQQWLPIHEMAASSNFVCPLYFLDLGLRFQRQDLMRYNSEGMLPLHLALRATKTLSKNRASAAVVANAESEDDTSDDGITSPTVKETANGSINEMSILKILTEDINAAKMTSLDGRRPIHHAVESQNSLSVINVLVKEYPNTIFFQDPVSGLHPVLLAAVDDNNSIDTVFELLKMDPHCICDSCGECHDFCIE